jgi:hypothetical protein
MSTTETDNAPTGDKPTAPASKWKKWAAIIPLAALIISLLVFLFGNNLYQQWRQFLEADQPPRFDISVTNTLGERNVYEVTNHIISGSPADPITMTWRLQIIPTYKGDTPYAEVLVLIKNKQGDVVTQSKWDTFDKDSKPLVVALDPYKLSQEVESIDLANGFRENIFGGGKFSFPQTQLSIEIVQASLLDSPLATDTLTLRNSPWYHYTALSAWHKGSIDVYVYGKNLGGRSDFTVVSDIFDIREIPGEEWGKWPRVDARRVDIPNVQKGQEFTTTVSFPSSDAFKFEQGKVYLVTTYLAKKQNYVQFLGSTWQSTGDIWRLGSYGTSHLITPSTPQGNTFQEKDGVVVMEAENFTGTVPGSGKAANISWNPIISTDYTNGIALKAEPIVNENTDADINGPALFYKVKFENTGDYNVYIRGLAPSGGNHDSIHVGLAGKPVTAVTASSTGMSFDKTFIWQQEFCE